MKESLFEEIIYNPPSGGIILSIVWIIGVFAIDMLDGVFNIQPDMYIIFPLIIGIFLCLMYLWKWVVLEKVVAPK